MSLPNDIQSDLQYFEGLRLTVYDDANANRISTGYTVVGHPSIGYGIALDTGGITKDEALYLLTNRINNFTAWATANLAPVWGTLSEIRQRVIVNMLYQVGVATYRSFKLFNAALASGNFDEAANQIINSEAYQEAPKRWQWLADCMRNDSAGAYE